MSLDEQLWRGILAQEEILRSSRRSFLGASVKVAGAVFAGEGSLSLYGCGGGGRGPTNPGPTPPPTGNAVLVGRFVNLANGNAYSGATVTVSGKSATTDAQGNFRVEGVGAGDQIVTLLGGGSLERRVKVSVAANATNNYGTIDTIPSDFPLDFFDRVCRTAGVANQTVPQGTMRWNQAPQIFADQSTLRQLPYKWSDFQSEMNRQVEQNFPALTRGLFDGARIQYVNTDGMPARDAPGTVYLAGFPPQRAAAEHYEVLGAGNVYISATISFGPAVSATSVAQDLCQILGFYSDYDGSSGSDSLFYDVRTTRIVDPSAKDLRMGEYLYSRPAGTKSQDDTSHLGSLAAASVAEAGEELLAEKEPTGKTGINKPLFGLSA